MEIDWPKWVVILVFTCVPHIITYSTLPHDTFSEPRNVWIIFGKRISKRWVFFACIILSLGIPIYQDHDSKVKEDEAIKERKGFETKLYVKDSILKHELERRDSISHEELKNRDITSQQKIDSNKFVVIEALAKYGLKYDESSDLIMKYMRDSVSKDGFPLPHLGFCVNGEIKLLKTEGNNYEFEIDLCNNNAPSKDIDIDVWAVVEYTDGEYSQDLFGSTPEHLELKTNATQIMARTLTSSIPFDRIYFLIIGHYTDSRGKHKLLVNALKFYDMKDNNAQSPDRDKGRDVRKYLRKNGIDN